MAEWLIERGIGETRAALVEDGQIVEARILLEGIAPVGSVIAARLADLGTNARNAVAVGEDRIEYLLPGGADRATQGATIPIEVTREAIPGVERWKRPLARVAVTSNARGSAAFDPVSGARDLQFPPLRDDLRDAGWDDLMDEARTGTVAIAGGELRLSATPAMTLIDVDGYLAPEEVAVVGAQEAARAIRRMDIGGSIGIDLPTTASKTARQSAAAAIDHVLPQPFERTAVNGFGFVQIVRRRLRASLLELAQDRGAFEARSLLRHVALQPAGSKRLVTHPAVHAVFEQRPEWIAALSAQAGGTIELRADPSVPIFAGYAEPA